MTFKTSLLLAAGVAGLLAISPAQAQDTRETVTVIAPAPSGERDSITGAPMVNAAYSQQVDYSDLNLRTAYGARELRARITLAAKTVCQKLDMRYPAPNNDRCMEAAYHDAIVQADDAIADARNYDRDYDRDND